MKKEEPIIEAKDIYFSYDLSEEHSLNGVDLKIYKGQKIAFMGANGSGKSTFFLCCNGIHKPEKGQLYFAGAPISYDKKGLTFIRSKVGIVFQDPDNQLFSASVYQEISFGILNQGVEKERVKTEVESLMAKLGITDLWERPTHALSGGQKKLVSIADILIMKPAVMILDEPAAALDPKHTKLINHIIEGLTEEGITVMLATHDVDYAYEWADEIVVMEGGCVLKTGSPLTVFEDKETLAKANLYEPMVLRLFKRLQKKGILSRELVPPKSMNELESYIEERGIR